MRSRRAMGVAATVMAGACLTGGAAAFPHDQSNRPAASRNWPWRLVDRSPDLVKPKALTVDRSIGERRARLSVHLAQRLYTFWNTGRTKYLYAAISPEFRDNTLPPGRPQGPAGPVFASKNFRAAIPDLTCELSDALVTGDKITARLVFRGHFTGTFNGVKGRGQKIDFNAIDIQLAGTRKIIADWHIEDNETLLHQMGIKR